MADCHKCKSWDSGDPDVGLNAGCMSEHMCDENGNIIESLADEIEDIIASDSECPYFEEMNRYQVEYHVIALSQCEELEPNQLIGNFPTELKALDFIAENRPNYWNLEIQKCCAGCHKDLEFCQCTSWNY